MLQILHPRCQAFFDHWRTLPRRGAAALPHTEDYLDQAPVRLMGGVFIHDIVDDALIVRFMGTDLVQRWQRDDTGRLFGAHLSQADKDHVLSIAKTIVQHPCGVLQHGTLGTSAGREATFEGVLLPLAVSQGAAPRIIVFSTILNILDREEHGREFSSPGQRWWLDVGAGVPGIPLPP